MHTSSTIRKVFEGVATRAEMHRMFNRHRGNPAMAEGEARHLFASEWFEIAESEYDYMLELLPAAVDARRHVRDARTHDGKRDKRFPVTVD